MNAPVGYVCKSRCPECRKQCTAGHHEKPATLVGQVYLYDPTPMPTQHGHWVAWTRRTGHHIHAWWVRPPRRTGAPADGAR